MAFYREATDQPFTVIANQSLQDPNLSFEATGLLAYMLSLPVDWKYSRDWLMRQKQKIGRDKLKRLLKELEENGYLERKYTQDEKGRMSGHDWLVKPVKANGDKAYTDGLKTRPPVSSTVEETATTNKTVLQSKQVSESTVRARDFSADPSGNFADRVMAELLTSNLPERKHRYAQLKLTSSHP